MSHASFYCNVSEKQKAALTYDQFYIVNELGKGAFGVVFKAVHVASATTYALKQCLTDNQKALDRELQVMKACDNPHIVGYFNSFNYEKSVWHVLEYCALGSIKNLMRLAGMEHLSVAAVAAVMSSSLQGLEYMHKLEMIHRDIKPENLLLTRNGEVKLGDFGTSLVLHEGKTNTLTGTPYYLAPEVLDDIGYGIPADVWSIGICAIELLEGHPPYYGLPPMKVMSNIRRNDPPSLQNPTTYDMGLIDFVKDCLNKNVKQRPTAHDLLQNMFIKNAKKDIDVLKPYVEIANIVVEECGGLDEAIKKAKAGELEHKHIIKEDKSKDSKERKEKREARRSRSFFSKKST